MSPTIKSDRVGVLIKDPKGKIQAEINEAMSKGNRVFLVPAAKHTTRERFMGGVK